MNCTNCGAQNLDGAKFCAGCGSPLATAEQPAYQQPAYQPQQPYGYAPEQQPQQPYGYAPYPQQPQQPKKPINYKLIGIIAGVAAIALILFLVLGGGGASGAAGVAEDFWDACMDGDADKARELSYGDMQDEASEYCMIGSMGAKCTDFEVKETESVKDKGELEELAYDYDIEGKLEEVQIVETEVTLEFMGQEQSGPMTFVVGLIDGDWYVLEMDD